MNTIDLLRHERHLKIFRAGQCIFQQGQPGDVLYGVVEGAVDIVYDGQVLETVTVGGVFGELALLDNEPRAASALARTDCKLVIVSQRRFLMMVQSVPFFALHVMQIMAERLRRQTAALPETQ